jgi:hypothetical protein
MPSNWLFGLAWIATAYVAFQQIHPNLGYGFATKPNLATLVGSMDRIAKHHGSTTATTPECESLSLSRSLS